MNQAQIQAEIERIEQILASGATEVDSDGERVTLDHSALRKRLGELKSLLVGQRHRGRKVRTIDLRNAF